MAGGVGFRCVMDFDLELSTFSSYFDNQVEVYCAVDVVLAIFLALEGRWWLCT